MRLRYQAGCFIIGTNVGAMISSGLRSDKLSKYDTDDTSTNISNCTAPAINYSTCQAVVISFLIMGKNIVYKTVDLFGNEQIQLIEKKRTSNKTLFTDYEGFVDKFEHKKTTDDCYTPKEVMDIIINYVNDKYPL